MIAGQDAIAVGHCRLRVDDPARTPRARQVIQAVLAQTPLPDRLPPWARLHIRHLDLGLVDLQLPQAELIRRLQRVVQRCYAAAVAIDAGDAAQATAVWYADRGAVLTRLLLRLLDGAPLPWYAGQVSETLATSDSAGPKPDLVDWPAILRDLVQARTPAMAGRHLAERWHQMDIWPRLVRLPELALFRQQIGDRTALTEAPAAGSAAPPASPNATTAAAIEQPLLAHEPPVDPSESPATATPVTAPQMAESAAAATVGGRTDSNEAIDHDGSATTSSDLPTQSAAPTASRDRIEPMAIPPATDQDGPPAIGNGPAPDPDRPQPSPLPSSDSPPTPTSPSDRPPTAIESDPGWGPYTPWAGLGFLLPACRQLGVDTMLAELDPAAQQAHWARIIGGIADRLGCPADDPWRDFLDALLVEAIQLGADPANLPAVEVPASWLQRLGPAALSGGVLGALVSVLEADLLERTGYDLPGLCQRPGHLHWADRHLTISFPLDHADLRLRTQGLDHDPGWLPGLGWVVRFHFRPWPDPPPLPEPRR